MSEGQTLARQAMIALNSSLSDLALVYNNSTTLHDQHSCIRASPGTDTGFCTMLPVGMKSHNQVSEFEASHFDQCYNLNLLQGLRETALNC